MFRRLKEVFMTELVLAIPDLDKEMRVEIDASDYVTGEVLSVKCGNCYDLAKWLSHYLYFFSFLS